MPVALIVLVTLVTTTRHEGGHALAALLSGVPIQEVRLLPGIHPERGFYFGYVEHGDSEGWFIDAAPFILAVLWTLVFLVVLRRTPRRSRLWFPMVLIGLISPLADLAYNYQGGLWREGTDVSDLLAMLPDAVVHVYFIIAIGICILGLIEAQRQSMRRMSTTMPHGPGRAT